MLANIKSRWFERYRLAFRFDPDEPTYVIDFDFTVDDLVASLLSNKHNRDQQRFVRLTAIGLDPGDEKELDILVYRLTRYILHTKTSIPEQSSTMALKPNGLSRVGFGQSTSANVRAFSSSVSHLRP